MAVATQTELSLDITHCSSYIVSATALLPIGSNNNSNHGTGTIHDINPWNGVNFNQTSGTPATPLNPSKSPANTGGM